MVSFFPCKDRAVVHSHNKFSVGECAGAVLHQAVDVTGTRVEFLEFGVHIKG